MATPCDQALQVALLAEGVDRNTFCSQNRTAENGVALLAEGVDRNSVFLRSRRRPTPSPSSRRAWIEITRHESQRHRGTSPSSRRAWIEILHNRVSELISLVALLAEGVDRNSTNWTLTGPSTVALLAEGVDRNLDARGRHRQEVKSPSSRRAWIEIGSRFLSCSRSISRPPRGGRG